MANVKISDLTEDTSPAAGDWLETEDVSANASKKTSVDSLLKYVLSATSSAWDPVAWVPSFTNLTVGNGTVTASYVRIGKKVFISIHIDCGSTTSSSGDISVTNASLPVAPATKYASQRFAPVGTTIFHDTGTRVYQGTALFDSTPDMFLRPVKTDSTYAHSDSTGAPMTIASGDDISVVAQYDVD